MALQIEGSRSLSRGEELCRDTSVRMTVRAEDDTQVPFAWSTFQMFLESALRLSVRGRVRIVIHGLLKQSVNARR